MTWKIKRLTYGQLTIAQQLDLFLTGNIICPVIFDLNKKKTQKNLMRDLPSFVRWSFPLANSLK